MDLRQDVPRSPYALLAGRAWLPRAIDKAHAKAAGTLGDYLFPGPFDVEFLAFLGLTVETFTEAVAAAGDDAAVIAWVDQVAYRSPEAWDAWRLWMWGQGPDPANGGAVFAKRLAEVAPGRTDIRTWCHLLAVEEGYPVPDGATEVTGQL
jgi:hypothetical protein